MDSNFIEYLFGEINCVGVQAGIVENCWYLWLWVRVLVSKVDSREDVDQIDTLTNKDKGESELVSSVNFLHISFQAAFDIQESDETSTGIVW